MNDLVCLSNVNAIWKYYCKLEGFSLGKREYGRNSEKVERDGGVKGGWSCQPILQQVKNWYHGSSFRGRQEDSGMLQRGILCCLFHKWHNAFYQAYIKILVLGSSSVFSPMLFIKYKCQGLCLEVLKNRGGKNYQKNMSFRNRSTVKRFFSKKIIQLKKNKSYEYVTCKTMLLKSRK